MGKAICLLGLLFMPISMAMGSNLLDGLVGYWPFDGNANDISGNGNNGTIHGAILVQDRDGKDDGAMYFGKGNYISVPNSSTLNSVANTITIAAWIKIGSWHVTGQRWASLLSKGNYQYCFNLTPDDEDPNSNPRKSKTEIAENIYADFTGVSFLGKWVHVAVTYSGDKTCRSYVNGSLHKSTKCSTGRFPTSSDALIIGEHPPWEMEFFYGNMDDLCIYNRALSGSEIKALMRFIPSSLEIKSVMFNSNGGTGEMEDDVFEEGKEQKLSKNTYTKDGYVFQGWAETKADADNGFAKYRDEALITVDHDMTLYAVWANPVLTLTAESADWSSGSITLCCTDADTSGEKHKYTLQCFHDDVSEWVDVGDDRAIDVSLSADGKAHLTDGFFAERFDGIPPVKYRVRDKHNRASTECVTRTKYGIFVGLSHYSPSYQAYLTEKSGSPLTEDEDGHNAAYAASLCELAKTNGQLDRNNCFLLQDSLATYSNVSAAFNTILNDRKIKPGDICMLYFASHGTVTKAGTTTGGIYLYDKPNLDGADFYQEELLANHIKSLDPNEKGVAVVGILSACHSGAFIDSSAEQVCQYGWCQDQGLSDINVAWITAADVNSVSYGIFSDFLINYGWDNGWAWKKSGRGQDDKVVSFYDLADYAINQFQPIAARREISGGKINNDTMLKNIIAGTSIGPSSSLSAPGNPINVKASPEVANAESPNKVVVTWEQGTGGTPSEYYVIRRRKNSGEYLATLIGTKDRNIDADDAATRDNPMQYYIVAVNGAGVAVSEVPAEGWRSDVFLVELDVDGGTLPLGTETPMSVSVSSPTIQNLPTPDKYGYEFSGWFWDSERTRTVNLGSQISRDVIIHAKWISIPRYTVAFKYALPGISYVSPPQIVYSNLMRGTKLGDKVITDTKSIAEEAINAHEIRNYVFKGWFSECYGRGVQATKDTVVVNDAEYFAYWEWNGSEPPMPQVWLDSHSTFAAASNGETLRAAAMTAANGCRTVAECYALGINPEDPNDDFKISDFKMKDGKPVITLNHTNDGSGNSFAPRIKTLGKANITDAEWREVPENGDATMRFFKVMVEMP